MNSTLLFIFALLSLFCFFRERNFIDGKVASNYQIEVSKSEQNKINALKEGKETYTVEIFVFVDHASYQKWYKLAGRNRTQALNYIELYFGHIIDETRKVYETVDLPGIWITCDLIGYYIAEDSTALLNYDNAVTNNGEIDSIYALSMLGQWITSDRSSKKPVAPRFDIGIIFTGYKMLSGAGYGYLSSACTDWGISIVEDSNYFFTLHTTVHELGHNLGLNHDGNAGCNDDDSYIMSETKLGMNIKNLFKFSHCSITQLQTFFNELKSKNNNCLLNKPSKKYLKKLKMLPGLQYSYDEQCKIYYGESSSMCREYFKNEQSYSNMCENIYCWDPERNGCWGLSPADGTSCGDNKWCMRKNCVSDSRAPILDKKCPFGDYGGKIFTKDRGLLSCSEIATYTGEYCEVDFYKSEYCCESCNKSAVSQPPKIKVEPVKPDVKKPEKNVECKDVSWCSKQPFLDCYKLKDTCCLSCKKKYDASKKVKPVKKPEKKVECKDVSWCPKQPFLDCYKLKDTCCLSCKKKYDASKRGCEYGDRVPWCREYTKDPGVCEDQYIRKNCCQTC